MNKDLGKPIPAREITPESWYFHRRAFVQGGLALGGGAALGLGAAAPAWAGAPPAWATRLTAELPGVKQGGPYRVDEPQTPWKDVTGYNNYYEFGTDKSDPAENAHTLKTRPWTVAVEGEVKKPQTFELDKLLRLFPLEERIYRLRCVEAWSMVIPWVGFPLGALVKLVEPTANAKFVAFTSVHRPEQMPGQRRPVLEWPYVEGLRIDEAVHPLTLMAVGLYGRVLPNQNGAPMRLVVPWKYGFKGIKGIVKIRFVAKPPPTAWNVSSPNEYGFYSNVNPDVDHPRWSQARERRIGEFLKRKTLPFNGYATEVAHLYQGMDPKKFF